MIRPGMLVSILGLSLVIVLVGCARTAPPVAEATGKLVPPDRALVLSDGTVLPARVWSPPPGTVPRGVILALHGFGDSRDAWELPAPIFAADGWLVVAPDQRGFGATADRGSWAGAARMVDDAAELVTQLRADHPGARVVVMGESMGGAVALCLAARAGAGAPDATVLLAPAVWGRREMGTVLSSGLWIASRVAPAWRLSGGQVPREIWASDNRDALLRLAQDPLTVRDAKISTLKGMVDLMDAAQAAAAQVKGPMLVLAGRRDMVVPPAAMAAAWTKLPAEVRRGFYPDGYHLLLRDQDRALVSDDILSWLDDPQAWLPSGADVAASAWMADRGWEAAPPPLPAALADDFERSSWPY